MARQVRIELAGAIYHCMARGDWREPIVKDDRDREKFGELLGELVERTGFEIFVWVLMGNHYHLVFKTPEPNLVWSAVAEGGTTGDTAFLGRMDQLRGPVPCPPTPRKEIVKGGIDSRSPQIRPPPPKAVSPLRSATALQNPGHPS